MLLVMDLPTDGGGGGGLVVQINAFYTAGGGGGVEWNVRSKYTSYCSPLDVGKSIRRAIGWGQPWKSRLFWALKWQPAKLMYIKIPMDLFFIWRLDLMIFMGANLLLRPLDGVGPENLDFFVPKWQSLRPNKSLDFQGPPSSNGPYNGFSRIKTITSQAI